MQRVLVIRFSSLGDIALTLPGVEMLAKSGCEVHFLTKEMFRPLVQAHAHSAHIHTIPNHASFRELVSVVRLLKNQRYERVYDLHNNIRSWMVRIGLGVAALTVSKFRCKERVLFIFRRRLFHLMGFSSIRRAKIACEAVGGDRSESGELDTRVLKPCEFKNLPELESSLQKSLQDVSKDKGYVCVAAESAWGQKEWPVARFIEVARQLSAEGYGIVWLGLKPLPANALFNGSVDLTGKVDVPTVMAVMKNARVTVCNDSGLLHLSEAVGTPVVAIYGPTTEELGFGPRLKASKIAEVPLWCRPCSKTGRLCFRVFQRRKCLTDLTVANVLEVFRAVNGGKGRI